MTDRTAIAAALLAWHADHGRHDLPWQRNPTPYRVWISEIMLQQTQVATVIGYFDRFMQRFPDLASLAAASLDEVLHLWSGLGYYSRARNLHRTAQLAVTEFQGELPADAATLATLPGIGRSTAAAIRALSAGERAVIMDGNVRRVLARVYSVAGVTTRSTVARRLWQLADECTPQREVAAYTQAIMDLGATVCVRRRPLCAALSPRAAVQCAPHRAPARNTGAQAARGAPHPRRGHAACAAAGWQRVAGATRGAGRLGRAVGAAAVSQCRCGATVRGHTIGGCGSGTGVANRITARFHSLRVGDLTTACALRRLERCDGWATHALV